MSISEGQATPPKKRGDSDPLRLSASNSKKTPRKHSERLSRIHDLIQEAEEATYAVTPSALLLYWKSSSVTRLRQKNFKQLSHSFIASEGITAASRDLGITREQVIELGRMLGEKKHSMIRKIALSELSR